MRLFIATFLLFASPVIVWELAASPNQPEINTTIYDSNPSRLSNRLYAALLFREDRRRTQFGAGSLDPLLWTETEHLLASPSHGSALRVLDEFLQARAEIGGY